MNSKENIDSESQGSGNFSGILQGITNLVGTLGELAETVEKLSKTGETHYEEKGKNLK